MPDHSHRHRPINTVPSPVEAREVTEIDPRRIAHCVLEVHSKLEVFGLGGVKRHRLRIKEGAEAVQIGKDLK